jgi:hypothetical protein
MFVLSSLFCLPFYSLCCFFVFLYLNFLLSLALQQPWPPPQNPAEFLGGFTTIFFYRVELLTPRPTPIPEDQASVFISSRGRVATHFGRLLRHAWVTVGLFLFPGHHTGILYLNIDPNFPYACDLYQYFYVVTSV